MPVRDWAFSQVPTRFLRADINYLSFVFSTQVDKGQLVSVSYLSRPCCNRIYLKGRGGRISLAHVARI